jgi:hypothetical protein
MAKMGLVGVANEDVMHETMGTHDISLIVLYPNWCVCLQPVL